MARFGAHIPAGLRDLVPFAKTKKPKKRKTRRSRLKNRKRKRMFWLVSALLVVLIGGTVFLLRLDTLAITDVAVQGTEAIHAGTVAEYVHEQLTGTYAFVIPKRNTLIYPKASIEAAVRTAFPRIKTLAVSRTSRTSLVVTITEREPYAMWCGEAPTTEEIVSRENTETCFFLDATGFIFAKAPNITGNVHFAYYGDVHSETPLGTQYAPPQQFERIRALIDALGTLDREPIALTRPNPQDIFIYMRDGSYLKIGQNDDYNTVFANLQSVLQSDAFTKRADEKLEYIDLRFGKRVYYRFRNDESQQTTE